MTNRKPIRKFCMTGALALLSSAFVLPATQAGATIEYENFRVDWSRDRDRAALDYNPARYEGVGSSQDGGGVSIMPERSRDRDDDRGLRESVFGGRVSTLPVRLSRPTSITPNVGRADTDGDGYGAPISRNRPVASDTRRPTAGGGLDPVERSITNLRDRITAGLPSIPSLRPIDLGRFGPTIERGNGGGPILRPGTTAPVPEPSAALLFFVGATLAGTALQRRSPSREA